MKFFRISACSLALLVLPAAVLASDYTKVVTHLTTRSPEHVLSVLTSYSQTCHSGCKYHAPDVKQIVHLDYKKTEKSWFTWTWVSTTIKDTKYFNQITRVDKPDGTVLLVSKMVTKDDAALAAELTKATGKPSDPALDACKFVLVVRKTEDGKTKFVQDVTARASGLTDMFASAIRDGIAAGTAANIGNIER